MQCRDCGSMGTYTLYVPFCAASHHQVAMCDKCDATLGKIIVPNDPITYVSLWDTICGLFGKGK
jgi:hypothetical protein